VAMGDLIAPGNSVLSQRQPRAKQAWNKNCSVRLFPMIGDRYMVAPRLLVALVFCLVPALASGANTEWRKYVIPSTGTNVDIPVTIFTEDAGPPEGGTGRRFFTKDHRANLTVQSVRNPENDSPATFLAKNDHLLASSTKG
jgi:hypothetical protein